jgi:ABC-type glutathione transport system ATPase component
MTSTEQVPILDVQGVGKQFRRNGGLFKRGEQIAALSDVSLRMARGEILGLVGESGSGKSTLGRISAGLEAADMGQAELAGRLLFGPGKSTVPAGQRRVGMIFQDPYASLNPRMQVGDIVGEGLTIAGQSKATIRERVAEALRFVGLREGDAQRRPGQFSGGQRQRIAIARAVVLEPDLLIADEAVSALDVSVQMQVLNLLLDVRERMGLAVVMITHNIAVVNYLCDSVAVLAGGRIVEHGPVRAVLDEPKHAYTQSLLASVPLLNPSGEL